MSSAASSTHGVAARAFTRSLNMLLKYVRLYGVRHKRSLDQFDVAWKELQNAVSDSAGLLLGVSGSKLLLDGVPLESGTVERAFAGLLTATGIASIQFLPNVTTEDFDRLVQAFSLAKPQAVIGQLKATLSSGPRASIRLNEIRYIEDDGHKLETNVAAQLTATLLEDKHADELGNWLNDPNKLLQLIFAAQGADKVSGDGQEGGGQQDGATCAASGGTGALQEDELTGVLAWLTQIAKTEKETNPQTAAAAMQAGLAQLPSNAVIALRQTLAHLATLPPQAGDEQSLLIRAAEHLAIRFALEKYERGEVKVNAVREMLDRMCKEIANLRRVLATYEEIMGKAGLKLETYAEILDRQFWASIPENGKLGVLLSDDAACIPARNVRTFVEELLGRGDTETVVRVLRSYAACVGSPDAETRRRAAIGLSDIADLYSGKDGGLLSTVLDCVGEQLSREGVDELKPLLGAAFTRLTQEANSNRDYPALEHSLAAMQQLEERDVSLARDLRPRVAVEGRLRDFLEDAIAAAQIPAGLIEVLRRTPQATAEQISTRLANCIRRREYERLMELLTSVGDAAADHLRGMLRSRSVAEGVLTVGPLTRLDMAMLNQELPALVAGWGRAHQDALVRQVSLGAAAERGSLLTMLLPAFDPLIKPLALGEISMSGDQRASSALLKLLETGDGENVEFLCVKTIEALARLREPGAEEMLANLVHARSLLGWQNHREIRIAAAQALRGINPALAERLLENAGLTEDDLRLAPLGPQSTEWARSRRSPRVQLARPLTGMLQTSKGRTSVSVVWLSMDGGVASIEGRAALAYEAILEMQTGLRRLRPQVLVRENRFRELTFEMVNMDLEERYRLRRILTTELATRSSGQKIAQAAAPS